MRDDDVASVKELVATTFVNFESRYTTAGQVGYARYLSDRLRELGPAGQALWVADVADEVFGFADVRELGREHLHLSRMCIAPIVQGAGWGAWMLRELDERYGKDRHWELNVFEHNRRAIALYRKLGLRGVGVARWYVRSIPTAGRVRVLTSNDPSPDSGTLERYGFGRLRLPSIGDFGVVGSTVRLPTPENYRDEELLGRINAAIPTVTEALLVTERAGNELDTLPGRVLMTAVMMRGRLSHAA